MDVFKALAAELVKMFAADLALTLTALATVAACAACLSGGLIDRDVIPLVLAAGVLAALAVGVIRGARR